MCTESTSCNFDSCKTHCNDDAQCNVFHFNTQGVCRLYYDSCSPTRTVADAGVTVRKIRNLISLINKCFYFLSTSD